MIMKIDISSITTTAHRWMLMYIEIPNTADELKDYAADDINDPLPT